MQKIMFNERYGLQSAVFEKIKTHTRRESFESLEEVGTILNGQGKLECYNDYNGTPVHVSRYAVGEVVAIAQSYHDIFLEVDDVSAFEKSMFDFYPEIEVFEDLKGWNNKMFVKAELMPHHIKILDIRCERLQDISNEDCLKEGVFLSAKGYYYIGNCETKFYYAEQSFKYIIGKLNGKKFWDTNPYVIVYEFELIKL